MKIIQTPEERFADLPDYPFAAHYAEIPDLEGGTLRMHYVEPWLEATKIQRT